MRRLRTNVTVGGVVLPAGTPDSHALAERITNPAAWEIDVDAVRRAAAEATAAAAAEVLAEEQRLRDEEQARLAEEQRLVNLGQEAPGPGPVTPAVIESTGATAVPAAGEDDPAADKPSGARRPRKATA